MPVVIMTALQVICPDIATTFPSLLDCGVYYECMPGKEAIRKTCGENLNYNPAIDSCDLPEHFSCSNKPLGGMWSAPNNACVFDKGYYYTHHETDCDKYYLCWYGGAYHKTCPMGLLFNNDSGTCDHSAAPGPCFNYNKCIGNKTILTSEPTYISSHAGQGSVNYDNNLNCDWYFRTCPTCGALISIELIEFSLENHYCDYDVVTLEIAGNPLLQTKLCGNQKGRKRVIDLSGYRNFTYPLRINFKTDSDGRRTGFAMKITAEQWLPELTIPPTYGTPMRCIGNLTISDKPQRLYSHAAFNGTDYESSIYCTWKLTPCVSCADLIIIEVEKFDLEGAAPCNHDWLALGDPSDPQTRKLCGILPERSTYLLTPTSAANRTVSINFRTDSTVGRPGFSLKIYSIAAARRFAPAVTQMLRRANQNLPSNEPYEKPKEIQTTTPSEQKEEKISDLK